MFGVIPHFLFFLSFFTKLSFLTFYGSHYHCSYHILVLIALVLLKFFLSILSFSVFCFILVFRSFAFCVYLNVGIIFLVTFFHFLAFIFVFERLRKEKEGSVRIHNVHSEAKQVKSLKSEKIYELLNFILIGSRKRSRYLLAVKKSGEVSVILT